jgi:response regulator RpfG family c-di-GMP phosphodiesterase
MHYIGKVAIPDHILNKPGKLDPDEWEIMKNHSILGFEMLSVSQRPLLQIAATIAYEHHEKWNGTGYPRRLQGEDIHIAGRITAIADVFDALGSDRCYKKSWVLNKILSHFEEEKAKHFDPNLIDLFFKNLEQFLEIREKYRSHAIF